MSVFLEILKCILCCQDEYVDVRDNQTSFPEFFRTTTGNYYNTFSNSISTSPLIDSTRNESTRQSRPSEYKVFIGSETSRPTSVGSLYPKPVERVYQGPQTTTSSSCTSFTSRRPASSPKSPPSFPSSSKPSSSSSHPSPLLKPTLSPLSGKGKYKLADPKDTLPTSSSKPPPFSPSSSEPSSPSSHPSPLLKPTLSPLSGKGKYKLADPKDTLPIYRIPKEIEDLIRREIVPNVLKKPLSPTTYQDYFAALLYAEDYYTEKWGGFELENVSVELHPASIYHKSGMNKVDDKTFAVFKVDSLSEKRPFLLSRDFVFAKPTGKKVEPFQGVIYRVLKSTTVLVEFGEDFLSRRNSTSRYDISFSFNRVCLKRAHQAIAAVSAPLSQKFLFPNSVTRDLMLILTTFDLHNHNLSREEKKAVNCILNFQGPPPFLVMGPRLCANCNGYYSESFPNQLSRVGLVVKEAVLQIYEHRPRSKILICTPTNSTCDVLMRSLKMEIPVSDMFRANAAFREIEGVPIDILPSCLYKKETECFSCPSLQELREFRVIFSTFTSSYRLYNAGVTAGHFSHIFLVDASSASEPESVVALANLADETTTVIVTGAHGNRSSHVRSDIARQKGLRISYFERLSGFGPYKNGNPSFIVQLKE